MSLVTPAEVNLACGFTATDDELQPWIDAAEALLPSTLAGTLRPHAVLLLTAHFWSVREPELAGEGLAGASITYARGMLGSGLKASRWGQEYEQIVRTRSGRFPVKVL